MSDYPNKLPVPHALIGYNATISKLYLAGDEQIKGEGPVGPFLPIPEGLPCFPRVVVQALTLGKAPNGPAWTWDQEADQGRGVWVIYDPEVHDVPQVSATLPDAEPERPALDLSASSVVELSQSADAPQSDDPPCCDDEDCECDEPSYDDEADLGPELDLGPSISLDDEEDEEDDDEIAG